MENQSDLAPGELKLTAGGGDYLPVPNNEPLKGHISSVKKGTGKNFDTGEPEDVLVVNFELDEDIEGRGQVYTAWCKPSIFSEKSKLSRLAKAVYGEWVKSLDPTDLIGRPLRFVLETKKKADGTERSIVTDFFPPAKDQKFVKPKPKDEVLSDNEIEELFK